MRAERGELGQVRGEGGVLESAAVEPGVEAAERAGADAPSAPTGAIAPSTPARRNSPAIAPSPRPPGAPPPDLVGTL